MSIDYERIFVEKSNLVSSPSKNKLELLWTENYPQHEAVICLLKRNEKFSRKLISKNMRTKTEPVVWLLVRLIPKLSDLVLRHPTENVGRIIVLDHRRSDLKNASQVLFRQPDGSLSFARKRRRAESKFLGNLKIILIN